MNYGGAIDLNCTGDAFPMVTAKWSTPTSNGFQIIGSPLRISSFNWLNQGDYHCLLDNGVKFAAIRKITLFGAEKSPNLLKPNVTEVNVFEGDDITMDCICERCESPANLWWFHETNPMPLFISKNSTVNLTYDQQLERIEMKNISRNKSGTYKCRIDCSQFNCLDEFSINVNVQESHMITENRTFYRCKLNDLIEIDHLGGHIESNLYSCRSHLDEKSVNFSIILVGKLFNFFKVHCFYYNCYYHGFIESNSTERLNEIRIHSNKSTSMSTCTPHELLPPGLTNLLHPSMHSMNFPDNDVFQCISSSTTNSSFDEKRLLVIFSKWPFE